MQALRRLIGVAALLQSEVGLQAVEAVAVASKPQKDHLSLVRREEGAAGSAALAQKKKQASSQGSSKRGINDEPVIANYGRHLTVTRKVSEKSSCEGACSADWSETTLSRVGERNSTMQVHGMFNGTGGGPSPITIVVGDLDAHKMARVSFVYWSMGEWSAGEKGTLTVDGVEVWSKERTESGTCAGWSECGTKFVNAPQNISCCQLVSKSFNHDGSEIQISIGSNIANETYAYAFSDVVMDLISD